MTEEGVYEQGDTLTLTDGTVLVAELADKDNCGCYVCDNGKEKCFFLSRELPCPKCHSSEMFFIDYSGDRVVFLPKTEQPQRQQTAIELIQAERERQISDEGYSESHDDRWLHDQLPIAAMVYASPAYLRPRVKCFWPWDNDYYKPNESLTIDGRIRELVKAGALIAAEIDRLNRAKNNEK